MKKIVTVIKNRHEPLTRFTKNYETTGLLHTSCSRNPNKNSYSRHFARAKCLCTHFCLVAKRPIEHARASTACSIVHFACCFIKKEIVLIISFILAVVSAFFVPIDGAYISYIDFRTLAILFCLMAIMAGFQKLNIFRQLGELLIGRVHTIRAISLIFILLCFFLSMLITNDVALITFVPFTIIVFTLANRKDMLIITIVLETVAANLGSMLLPMGNPQNIYLYSLTNMSFGEFVLLMLPFAGLSLAIIVVLAFVFVKNGKSAKKVGKSEETLNLNHVSGQYLTVNEDRKPDNNKQLNSVISNIRTKGNEQGNCGVTCSSISEMYTEKNCVRGNNCVNYYKSAYQRTPFEKVRFWMYIVLFVVSILVVVRVLDFRIGFIIVLGTVLIFDIKTLAKVDYSLLFTFIFLFIFIGNLKRIPEVSLTLSNLVGGNEVLASVISSQVISNVPAAILLSGFTENIKLLIVGTNLGGLGTLIASMASLISFKQYSNMENSAKGRYFLIFTIVNFAMLIVLFGFYLLIG